MPFIETTPHDENLPLPDQLTTLTINYIWRRHVAEALTQYFERVIPRPSADPDVQATWNNFHRLMLDLYDAIFEVQIMKFAAVHCDPTQVYVASGVHQILFDDSLGPYFTDENGLFVPASNTFLAPQAGLYALLCYFDSGDVNRSYSLYIRRVGDTELYAAHNVTATTSLVEQGTVVAVFRGDVADEFEILIGVAGDDINCAYGYAAFVQLALLS